MTKEYNKKLRMNYWGLGLDVEGQNVDGQFVADNSPNGQFAERTTRRTDNSSTDNLSRGQFTERTFCRNNYKVHRIFFYIISNESINIRYSLLTSKLPTVGSFSKKCLILISRNIKCQCGILCRIKDLYAVLLSFFNKNLCSDLYLGQGCLNTTGKHYGVKNLN